MSKRVNLQYEMMLNALISAMSHGQKSGVWREIEPAFAIYDDRTTTSRILRAKPGDVLAYCTDAACKLDNTVMPSPPGPVCEDPREEAERIARFQADARAMQRHVRESNAAILIGYLNTPGLCWHATPFHTIEAHPNDPAIIRFTVKPGKTLTPLNR